MFTRINKKDIFGVTETALSRIKGMERRYKVEIHETSDPNYLRQLILRDKSGNYFLHVKGGEHAHIDVMSASFPLNGKELLIPIAPEAMLNWAEIHLFGDEYSRALAEFERGSAMCSFVTVWQYQNGVQVGQPDYVCEFLVKTDINTYILFSTDASYPCFTYSTTWVDYSKGDSNVVIDLSSPTCVHENMYVYYVTPETARRWAEARGMDEDTCQAVFGQ